jgi:hypothetical protein
MIDLSDVKLTGEEFSQSTLDRIFYNRTIEQCPKIVRAFKAFALGSSVGIVLEPLCSTSLAGLVEHTGMLSIRLIRDIFFAVSDV